MCVCVGGCACGWSHACLRVCTVGAGLVCTRGVRTRSNNARQNWGPPMRLELAPALLNMKLEKLKPSLCFPFCAAAGGSGQKAGAPSARPLNPGVQNRACEVRGAVRCKHAGVCVCVLVCLCVHVHALGTMRNDAGGNLFMQLCQIFRRDLSKRFDIWVVCVCVCVCVCARARACVRTLVVIAVAACACVGVGGGWMGVPGCSRVLDNACTNRFASLMYSTSGRCELELADSNCPRRSQTKRYSPPSAPHACKAAFTFLNCFSWAI